jgi:hypothetical protein
MATPQFKLPEQYNISHMPGDHRGRQAHPEAKPTVVTQQPEWDRLLYDVFAKYWPDVYKYENKPTANSRGSTGPARVNRPGDDAVVHPPG